MHGTAIHWYESTYDYFPEDLQYAHEKAPNKYLIETEGCVDSEVPVSGRMMLGIGEKKLQIGVGIGRQKTKSICTQNMLQ